MTEAMRGAPYGEQRHANPVSIIPHNGYVMLGYYGRLFRFFVNCIRAR